MIGDGCTVVGDCGAIPNIECRVDGGGLLCLCLSGFADDGSGTNCAVGKCVLKTKRLINKRYLCYHFNIFYNFFFMYIIF